MSTSAPRLDERKVARPEAHLEIALEERAHELGERAFQVGEADVFVDKQALDLVEHRRVRLIRIAAIDLAGRDQADRRRLALHGADLHGRGMRAQQAAVAEVERVVHRARRMVRREIQRFEIVIVVFDLGTFGDIVAEPREDLGHAVERARDRMQPAALGATAGQRDVDALGREALIKRDLLERRLARGDRVGDRFLGAIDVGRRAPCARRAAVCRATSAGR